MRAFIFSLICGLTATFAASAEEVTICHADWPPYTAVKGTATSGITVDIYREALRRAGRQVRFLPVRWKRCLLSVREGKFHAVADSARREGFLQGPTYTAIFAQNIWVHQDSPLNSYDGPAILRDKRLGLVSGYVYPDSITGDGEIILDYAEKDETNLRKLSIQRIDMALSDLVNSRIFAQQHNLPIRPLTPMVSNNLLYPSFGPGHAALQAAMERELEDMAADGSIDRIYQSYLGLTFTELQKLAQPYNP